MMVNAAFLVLAGFAAIVTAQPLSLDDASSAIQQQAQNLQNIPQNLQNIPQHFQDLAQTLAGAPQQGLQYAQGALGHLTNRIGDAYVSTYDNTRENVHDALNTITETGKKGVESGMKLFKNGLGLATLLPLFFRNVAFNQPHTRANQYPAQYNPQLAQYNPELQQYYRY